MLLTANDGGEQATYRALFRHQERLSAKKEGKEERRGLTIWKMNPQCLSIGTEDGGAGTFELLADTYNS